MANSILQSIISLEMLQEDWLLRGHNNGRVIRSCQFRCLKDLKP